jgi:hypothetical protein
LLSTVSSALARRFGAMLRIADMRAVTAFAPSLRFRQLLR